MVEVSALELKNYLPLLVSVQKYLQNIDVDLSLPLIDHILQAIPSIFPHDFSEAIYINGSKLSGPQSAFLSLTNALPWCETRKVTPMDIAFVLEALSDYEEYQKTHKK